MISANSFVQWAGIAALENAGKDIKKMKKILKWKSRYEVNDNIKIN